MIYNITPTKTLGPRTARLFTELHERGQRVFDTQTAAKAMGVSPAHAAVLLHEAKKRGLVTPIKRGLYNLVPFELGKSYFHLEDRHTLVHADMGERPYFFSHYSAMGLHQLITQPIFTVYVTTKDRLLNRNLGGTRVRFITVKPKQFFGLEAMRFGENNVHLSNLSRTLLDGLRKPKYCAGITEVAKAFFMAKDRIDIQQLIEYAHRLEELAVIRRLGFIVEALLPELSAPLEALRVQLPRSFVLLEPDMPSMGVFDSRWGLRLNVPKESLLAAVST